jgi:hypothetical protein
VVRMGITARTKMITIVTTHDRQQPPAARIEGKESGESE